MFSEEKLKKYIDYFHIKGPREKYKRSMTENQRYDDIN